MPALDDFNFASAEYQQATLTVSGLTQQIKILVETGLPPVWLTGEISNFKRHSLGHFYFSLKDEFSQIPCVMWAGRNRVCISAARRHAGVGAWPSHRLRKTRLLSARNLEFAAGRRGRAANGLRAAQAAAARGRIV
jgi:hypothetical protein